jgi:hypothetical protein
MFGKGTWTLLTLPDDITEDNFKIKLKTAWMSAPVFRQSIAIANESSELGFSPFQYPRLGEVSSIIDSKGKNFTLREFAAQLDQFDYDPTTNVLSSTNPASKGLEIGLEELWSPDPTEWVIDDHIYAMWAVSFEYADVCDMNSRKESMAYEYGTPFKFQPPEIKQQIQAEVEQLDTIIRTQFQIVIDFERKKVWINTASKNSLLLILESLAEQLELTVSDYIPENDYNMEPGWNNTLLESLYSKSKWKDLFVQRSQDVKTHGPQGVEPNPNGAVEKILKHFVAITPTDGDEHVAIGVPCAIRLAPTMPTAIGARTPAEVIDTLEEIQGAFLESAPITFSYLVDKPTKEGVRVILKKRFSIGVSAQTRIADCPGFAIRGLNIENFKEVIKDEVKANSAISVKGFWKLWYYEMNEALYTYLNFVKEQLV